MSGGFREPEQRRDVEKEMQAELDSALTRDRARDEKRGRQGAVLSYLLFAFVGVSLAYPAIIELVQHGFSWNLLQVPTLYGGLAAVSLLLTFIGLRLRKRFDRADLDIQRREATAAKFIAAEEKRVETEDAKHRIRVGVDFGVPAEQLRDDDEALDEDEAAKRAR